MYINPITALAGAPSSVSVMTPWGVCYARHSHQVSPEIMQVNTASHGGWYVTGEAFERIPFAHREYAKRWARGVPNWFEEDCAVALVIVANPEHFTPEHLARAQQTVDWLVTHGKIPRS